VNNWEC